MRPRPPPASAAWLRRWSSSKRSWRGMRTAPWRGLVWWRIGGHQPESQRMQHFSPTRFDFIGRRLSYFRPMTPLAEVVLVLCAVVWTVAMVVTLASIRRAATRAETVLQLVEREIRPLASQGEGLATRG